MSCDGAFARGERRYETGKTITRALTPAVMQRHPVNLITVPVQVTKTKKFYVEKDSIFLINFIHCHEPH